jgi:hypothetical protein
MDTDKNIFSEIASFYSKSDKDYAMTPRSNFFQKIMQK